MKTKPILVALKILGIGLVCMIPTPTYGNHGGFFNESNKEPIDDMDSAFLRHDKALEKAYNDWQEGIKKANETLNKELKKTNPEKLYANIYRWMSLRIFK